MTNIYLENSYIKEIQTVVEGIQKVKKKPALLLKENIFYPGGGGQPYDKGQITLSTNKVVPVSRVLKISGQILVCLSENTEINVNDTITTTLDWVRRFCFMRYHTAAHVLMGTVRRYLSDYVPEGIEIADDSSSCKISFSGSWDQSSNTIMKIFEEANSIIGEERSVVCQEFDNVNEIKKKYSSIYRGPENLAGPIRTTIIKDWDANPCGGTHVRTLMETGRLTVNKFNSYCISFSLD